MHGLVISHDAQRKCTSRPSFCCLPQPQTLRTYINTRQLQQSGQGQAPPTMSVKRDADSLVYSDTEEIPVAEPNKRQKKQQSTKGKRLPAVDPTYGQKWAFQVTEGLGVPSDDDLEFEDQTEALEYLRSVQKETKKIPHVVAAPKAGPQLPPEYSVDRTIYSNGVGDSRGYYHDGAYTAAPDDLLSLSDEEEADDLLLPSSHDAQQPVDQAAALAESYFSSLTTRFVTLRSKLHTSPPQSAIDALPQDHEFEVASFAPKKPTFRMWTHRIRYTDPLPAQVAAMDKVSVLRLLRVILGGKFFRRGCVLRRRTSQWIWALLARLPDRGELDSDEIGVVRELGKRAVAVSIKREHVAALCEVLGREEVVAFGLAGVLFEIEGRKKKGDGEDEDEDVVVEEGGEVKNDDEIPLSPDPENGEQVPPAGRDASNCAPEDAADMEDGKLREEAETPSYRPNGANAAAEATVDLEEGELPKEVAPTPDPQPVTTQADGTDEEEMDMELDDDLEEGEVSKEPSDPAKDAAMAAMKARLLQDLDKVETWEDRPLSPPAAKKTDDITEVENMRATVNMILTVAGEFYGQRDLLAFREPFGEVPYETNEEEED
ncbi:hypothetical protein GE09DRAFT_1110073 [Coniochaeta sp. 2T2.1]|nr:hypothetical protein GE09DRAFT_1110073 [Coniochaeta sp. 2T2.1]